MSLYNIILITLSGGGLMSNSRGIGINEQNVSASGAFFSCYTPVISRHGNEPILIVVNCRVSTITIVMEYNHSFINHFVTVTNYQMP